MGGLIQQTSQTEDRNSLWKPVLIGLALVLVVVGVATLILRKPPKTTAPPDPYAAKLVISDLKMSAAENFIGASVTYIDGTVANTGDRAVIHAVVRVTFSDSIGQVAQIEEIPLHVLQTTGPYQEGVDLSASPLSPGQSKQFRLTFEHVSAEWNHAYPEVRVIEVTLK